MVGTETVNLFQWSGWRLKTHFHCRINCEKLVEGWLKAILLFYILEEDFEKNRIKCALAAGTTSATLGFVVTKKAKPMTLLKGNELNSNKSKGLDLVLRKKTGESKFNQIIVGNAEILKEYQKSFNDILSDDLLALMKDQE